MLKKQMLMGLVFGTLGMQSVSADMLYYYETAVLAAISTSSSPNSDFIVKKTGQTQSWNTVGSEVLDDSLFDDGYYMSGIMPSYTRDDLNDIVTDQTTGLMWQDNPDVETVKKPWLDATNVGTCNDDLSSPACEDTSGDTAATYCEDLILGGYANWRLPSVQELRGLWNYSVAPSMDPVFVYVNTTYDSSAYWTSTTVSGDQSNAWFVYSKSGGHSFHATYDKGNARYIRCVR
jgi:hypothetical protein